MQIDLTQEEATHLHTALMQLPNSSATYPVLLKLIAAVNTPATEEVEIS